MELYIYNYMFKCIYPHTYICISLDLHIYICISLGIHIYIYIFVRAMPDLLVLTLKQAYSRTSCIYNYQLFFFSSGEIQRFPFRYRQGTTKRGRFRYRQGTLPTRQSPYFRRACQFLRLEPNWLRSVCHFQFLN